MIKWTLEFFALITFKMAQRPQLAINGLGWCEVMMTQLKFTRYKETFTYI
jgi:hypothetical protein